MRIQLYTSICIAQATHMHDLSTSHDFQNLTPLSLSEVGVPATSELFSATSELGPINFPWPEFGWVHGPHKFPEFPEPFPEPATSLSMLLSRCHIESITPRGELNLLMVVLSKVCAMIFSRKIFCPPVATPRNSAVTSLVAGSGNGFGNSGNLCGPCTHLSPPKFGLPELWEIDPFVC